MKRRHFLYTTGTVLAGLNFPSLSGASLSSRKPAKNEICLFSKHLQYLTYQEMSEILAETGFDGIDLTVRPGGHVEPAYVERDLSKAVKAAHSAGLSIPMITTGITDPEEKNTHKILKTAGELGVKYYRMGSLKYDFSKSMEDNIQIFRGLFERFESLNRKYGIHGDYQNHWGNRFGAPVWDLYAVLKGLEAEWIGSQYDIRHALVEGGGSWMLGMKALAPFIASTVIKDFIWAEENGKWRPQSVPLGTGMVDFEKYFEEFKKLGNFCPISLHYEYGMGHMKERTDPGMTDEKIIAFYKMDLDELKSMLTKAGLR